MTLDIRHYWVQGKSDLLNIKPMKMLSHAWQIWSRMCDHNSCTCTHKKCWRDLNFDLGWHKRKYQWLIIFNNSSVLNYSFIWQLRHFTEPQIWNSWWCWKKSQVIAKINRIQHLRTMNIFTKFHATPCDNCWDISVWGKVAKRWTIDIKRGWHTDTAMPKALLTRQHVSVHWINEQLVAEETYG